MVSGCILFASPSGARAIFGSFTFLRFTFLRNDLQMEKIKILIGLTLMDAYLCSRLLIASADFSSFTASSLSSLCTLSSETWYFSYLSLWKPVSSVAVKQADRQASWILKWGQVSRKIFGYPYFKLPLAGRWARFAAITGLLFPDYILQRMRGMAMDSGLLRPVPTRCLTIDAFLFLWCIGIHYAL